MNRVKKLVVGLLIAIALMASSTGIVMAEEEPGGIYFGIPWGGAGCFVVGICKVVW